MKWFFGVEQVVRIDFWVFRCKKNFSHGKEKDQEMMIKLKLFSIFLCWCLWQGKIHWFNQLVEKDELRTKEGFERSKVAGWHTEPVSLGSATIGHITAKNSQQKLTWNPIFKKDGTPTLPPITHNHGFVESEILEDVWLVSKCFFLSISMILEGRVGGETSKNP